MFYKNQFSCFGCFLFVMLTLWGGVAVAQDETDTVEAPKLPPPQPKARLCMSEYAASVYQNKTFASIATGQTKTSDLANYAAFDPTKGNFTLNGFVAFSRKNKDGDPDDSLRSYLSFALQGGLLNDNATALFQNAKLNTSISVSAKYHVRLKNLKIPGDFIICKGTDASITGEAVRRLVLEDSAMVKAVDTRYDRKMTEYYLLLLQMQDAALPDKIDIAKEKLKGILLQLQHPDEDDPPNEATKDSLTKDAGKLVKNIDSLGKLSVTNKLSEDSVIAILQHQNDSVKAAKAKIRQDYAQKILNAELGTTLFSVHQQWFTAITGLNTQKYYTYFASLPFAQQIAKNNFTTYSLGLQYNIYWQNLTEGRKRRLDYANVGLLAQRNNNTGDLSTQTINQKATLAENDTTREITTSYTAYTSPVVSFNEWNLYFNYYHLFGPKVFSGFHVYPNIEFRNTGQTLLNVGVGYVISLPNKTSGNPAINAEVYWNFADMTNALGATTTVFQRGTLGIQIGLPFNFLTK